jgi:iron complex transport system substrate-binding protein
LIRANVAVHAFNQRDVAGILAMIRTLGALIGASANADALAASLAARLDGIRAQAATLKRKPRVYFEEWDEPMITGIGWVSELIAIAGGSDIFAELAAGKSAKERIVSPEQIRQRAPDIIIGSWCGKKFNAERVAARLGFDTIPAVRNRRLYEIKSSLILQPGPAALTDGLRALERLIQSDATAF